MRHVRIMIVTPRVNIARSLNFAEQVGNRHPAPLPPIFPPTLDGPFSVVPTPIAETEGSCERARRDFRSACYSDLFCRSQKSAFQSSRLLILYALSPWNIRAHAQQRANSWSEAVALVDLVVPNPWRARAQSAAAQMKYVSAWVAELL